MELNAREAAELLEALAKANPQLLTELVAAQSKTEDVDASFTGEASEPTVSQTRKSLKYEAEAWLGEPEKSPKVIAVFYLPPEVAAETISFEIVSVGPKAQPRMVAAKRRRKAA